MEAPTKDLKELKGYKCRLRLNIMEAFHISENEAKRIIELLEQEDFLKLDAPQIDSKPATVLIEDRHIIKREISMASHKLGNVWINTYLDWRELAGFVFESVGAVTGMELGQPLLFWSAILAAVIAASRFMDINLDENQTAIIMALQKYKKHGYYRTNEEECFAEANKILHIYGYPEMEKSDFSEKVVVLDATASSKSKVNSIILLRTAHMGVYRLLSESYSDFEQKIAKDKYNADLSVAFALYSNFGNQIPE